MARIPSTEVAPCASMMQRMDLNSAPLGNGADSPIPERCRPSSRNSSTGTAIRVSSGATPTTRRISNLPKQPLGVNLDFGNSPSTVRHFKRVSSGERRAALSSNPPSTFQPNPTAQTFRPSPPNSTYLLDMNNENSPPEKQYAPTPVTKDALYGRRAYSKVLDSVFQEAYSDSGSPHQREAIGKVSQAWAQLDQVDPQGEFLLLKAMVDRLKDDSRLASALGISVSHIPTPIRHDSKTSESSLSGTTVHGTSTTRVRSSTTTSSMTSVSRSTSDQTFTPEPTPVSTPNSTPNSTTSYALKGPKLILAQNNSHLKSHRRRQSAVMGVEKGYDVYRGLDENKLPGFVERGMEQQGLLADILYGQWIQGLKSRWPLA